MRKTKAWKNLIFIEAGEAGKTLTAVTLFVTEGAVNLKHESRPSFCLACLDIGNGRFAQLVAHADPEGNNVQVINAAADITRTKAMQAGISLPDSIYVYVHGRCADGARFMMCAPA